MKRKDNEKAENQKTIDPTVLEEILGGVAADPAGEEKPTIIPQPPFNSFYHS
jgi:hypothetical protein